MINNKLNQFILHASLINGIGPKTIEILTNNYVDVETDFYNLQIIDLIKKGLNQKKAELLYNQLKDFKDLEDEIDLLRLNKASFITPFDDDYPNELKNQEIYPAVLYQQKNSNYFNINNFISLSVVSSRETNAYGKRVIYKLFEDLAGQNIAIISGGAIGGDTYVHEAAIANGLKTISVIGSGLANWYPKINIFLFNKIIDNGGVIMSNFQLNTLASKITFPIRNSVIAGMSRATLVIQAGVKSGTLITANFALEYGKDVGAVPGYIDDIIMIESNNLIKNGAHCITSGEDILSMLGFENLNKSICINNNNNNNLYNDCTVEQKKILELCIKASSIDDINSELNLEISQLYDQLFLLLEKKYIMQDILGNWKTIK